MGLDVFELNALTNEHDLIAFLCRQTRVGSFSIVAFKLQRQDIGYS